MSEVWVLLQAESKRRDPEFMVVGVFSSLTHVVSWAEKEWRSQPDTWVTDICAAAEAAVAVTQSHDTVPIAHCDDWYAIAVMHYIDSPRRS